MLRLRRLLGAYARGLERRPLRTNMATALGLGAASDVCCQLAVEGAAWGEFDWRRLAAIALFSTVYNGGICTKVYPLYGRFLPAAMRTTPLREGVGSTLIDNLVHSPVFYIPTFFMSTEIMRGKSFEDAWAHLQNGYKVTVLSTWAMWVPLQLWNFSIVPPQFRVLVLAAGGFIYVVQVDWISEWKRVKKMDGNGR